MRSKKIWVFVAVLLCLACVMLLNWSHGRAQQQAAEYQRYVAFSEARLQPGPYNVVHFDGSASLDAPQQPANKLSEFWIGVDGSPADDVLRAQLELPAGQGLIVNQVVAAGPAEHAGLKQYDVLLIADDKPIAQISDLAEYIQQKKDAAITLKVVRSGKPLAIAISPQRRPASQTGETCPQVSPLDDAAFARHVYLDILGALPTAEESGSFANDQQPDKRVRLANDLLRRSTVAEKSCSACHAAVARGDLQRWFLGERIAGQYANEAAHFWLSRAAVNESGSDLLVANGLLGVTVQSPQGLPDDMTLTITRKGKEPARIQVARGDQSWGTTESKVDELPEDVRGHVKQFISSPLAATVQPALTYRKLKANEVALEYLSQRSRPAPVQTAPAGLASVAPKKSDDSKPQNVPAYEQVDQQLKNLTRELEQLRKVFEDLRPSVPVQPTKPDIPPDK